MFEMFALLINLLILTISDTMITCYLFSFYLYLWSSPTQRIAPHHLLYCIFENLLWEFATRICLGYLPQDFAMGICCRTLWWLFAARICNEAMKIFCKNLQLKFAVGISARICQGYLQWKFFAGICHANLPWVFFYLQGNPFFV